MGVCPNCGQNNAYNAKFCSECATPLKAKPSPQEERKVVSVLFVDLVGFTARFHDTDPEDIRAVLVPYHQRLKTEIEAFGGTVEKFIGDAVMAVFGAPLAHEDDAERAVRAALRISEAIQELNDANPTLGLSIRAAINTGEGLVNLSARPHSGEGIVTGDVVNTASRLQGAAPVDGVVVGEITFRSTKDLILYEEMEPVAVKGKPEPVPVWRALSARGRFGVDAEVRYTTPFIGREIDLTLLKTTYLRAIHESSLQLVTVAGEPGVGKSRLLAEFYRYIDEQPELITWRQGRSLPYGEGITFWALGEIVKAQAGINESDSANMAADKLATAITAVVSDDSDRAWLRARVAPLVGATGAASGGVEKEESFTAWLRFLEAIASSGPLVVVFEDLHWADTALLEFLDHLVEWSVGVPILVVCTTRPELFENYPTWSAGTRNATTISLSPLSDSEIAQLIAALLSQAALPAEIHTELLKRAGGNPLYAEEFVRMLFDRGLLHQRGRTVTLDHGIDLPVPVSVQSIIAARLDTLPDDHKSLLHSAAVVGKVFWSGAIAFLMDLDDSTVRRSLQALVRKELVRRAKTSSVEGQYEYSFWHALTREVAYGQIPRPQRADKHKHAAAWLERIAGERVSDHAEVLAHHFESAIDLLRASGLTTKAAELEKDAVRFFVLAGERSSDLNPAKARQYYERALSQLPADDTRRGRVLLSLGFIANNSGHPEDAVDLYNEARQLFRLGNDKRGEGEATAHMSSAFWRTGQRAEARSLSHASIALLEQVTPGPELAFAYQLTGEDAFFAGNPTEVLVWADKAIKVGEQVGNLRKVVAARVIRGSARTEMGDEGGLADLRWAYDNAVRLGLPHEASFACAWLSNELWLSDGPASGLRTYEQGIWRAERYGLTANAMYSRAETLWMLYDLGDWDKLLKIGRQVVEWSERTANRAAEAAALPYMVGVSAWRQQQADARSLTQRLLPLARQMEDLQVLVPALVLTALVEQLRGNLEAGVDHIDELEMITRNSAPWRSRQLPTALRILTAAKKLDEAESFASGIEVTATRDRNCVLTGRAILAEAKGQIAEARDHYQEAAHQWADFGFALEEGQAHLGFARCVIAGGGREVAREPLHKARAVFSSLGAAPLIKETDSFLQADEAS